MNQDVKLYPLLFEPSLHVKVWGGRQMESRLGKTMPPGEPVGESWEIFWKNRVRNGALKGKTLHELIEMVPQRLVGNADADPEFPLLVKFIDAQDWLSVQVHPDDALAASLESQPRGKTECWYIVDAAPGAQIAYGLSEALDAEGFRQAIASGRAKEVLQYVPVVPGDFIYVPAGTLHAIGPGTLIYELQQASDTTYRVYDWDRPGLDGKPRELHLDKALRCTHYDVCPSAKIAYQEEPDIPGIGIARLIQAPYFSLDKITLEAQALNSRKFTIDYDAAHLLTALRGRVTLYDEGNAYEPVVLTAGNSAFIPFRLGPYRLVPGDETAEVLQAWTEVL